MTRSRNEALTDPWVVLGVAKDAGLDEIQRAYLREVKAHPPDRDPEGFERVRDAREALVNPSRRFQAMLEEIDPWVDLDRLFDQWDSGDRRFVGPDPWLEALKRS